MSNNYDIRVMWHMPDGPHEERTVPVAATTSTIALKLGRRAIFQEHPGALIDKTEIVYDVTAASITSPEPDPEKDTPAAPEAEQSACVLTAENMHTADDCATHIHEEAVPLDNPTSSDEPEPHDTHFTKIAAELGGDFLTALVEACEEFAAKPNNIANWQARGRQRLFLKIAKVQETKFTKGREKEAAG